MMILVLAMLVALPVAGAGPGALDPSFAGWLQEGGKVAHGEVAHRFLAAAGRDADRYRIEMDALEKRFRASLGSAGDPRDARGRCEALARFFFVEEGFRADLDLERLENLFPDAILRRRRGYCLGLSLVLLDLTERLRWPMVAVSAPRHTFLRFLSKPPLNLETTLSGEIHDDRWYHGRFASGIEDTPLKPMSPRDIGAHLLNNHGFVLLEGGMPEGAARDFAGALSVAPGLVEAIINQGVCAARQGDYRQALGAFEKALGHWPGDPFTRLNRANAMISAGRGGEGALELARLLARHPDFPGLAERARTVRGELRPERDWASVQEISTVLNRRRAVRAGKSPGLRAVYFRDRALRSAVLRRIDRDLSFRWSWDAPAATVPRDNFSIRWEGWLSVDRDDSYTFYITCSDGVRIWIDGRQVLNAWRRANDNFPVVEVPLKEGLHDLRIEYFEAIGEAGIVVLLTAEREDRPLTLARHLWHAGNSPGSR